jgi:hypothetical protein
VEQHAIDCDMDADCTCGWRELTDDDAAIGALDADAHRGGVFADIERERQRQEAKWGRGPLRRPLQVLVEEVGEVARALEERDVVNLRAELVQVAAVCCRWLEHFGATPAITCARCKVNPARYDSGLCGVCDVVHNGGAGTRL